MSDAHLRFQRANFVVEDLDKSLQLYRDVLGFEIDLIKDSPSDSYSYPVFEIDPSVPIRFAVLNTATQARVMALTEVPTSMEAAPLPRRSAIVLDVADVDAVVNGAREIGCHVYDEGELNTHDGRRGREVGLLDFDDNLVVIYNIPASR